MIHIITDHFWWKLMSLVIAVLLWMVVVGDPELTTSISVPMEFKNIPKDLEISSDVPDRLRLEIRGPAGKLIPENLSDAAIILDLTNVHQPGERTFDINERNLNLPQGTALSRAIPSQVRLRFEHKLIREVPVQVRFAGAPPAGYRVAHQDVQPERLRIVGPESRVLQVEGAETDPIDLGPVVSEASFTVHTYVPDPQVRFSAGHTVVVRVRLEKVELDSTTSSTDKGKPD